MNNKHYSQNQPPEARSHLKSDTLAVGCNELLGGMGVIYPFPSDFLCDGVVWELVTINGNETLRVTDSAAKQFEQYKWRKEHQIGGVRMFELLIDKELDDAITDRRELGDGRWAAIGNLVSIIIMAQRRKDAQALLRQKRIMHGTNGITNKITVEFSVIEWHEINKLAEGKE